MTKNALPTPIGIRASFVLKIDLPEFQWCFTPEEFLY